MIYYLSYSKEKEKEKVKKIIQLGESTIDDHIEKYIQNKKYLKIKKILFLIKLIFI